MFHNIYKNKKILITGNTGFKGSWLTVWLLKLGAKVIGISKDIPTSPSMYEKLNLNSQIKYYNEDICNLEKIKEIILKEEPDFVFHLAAQAIVSISYTNPIETISSNVIGTTNILEALRISNHKCVTVMITSDKSYENIEQIWGYKESDKLGGKDIYSGSKGAAELIIKSYYNSFFNHEKSNIKLGIGRAGNVIGGGDWAKNRIVVDCMIAWSKKQKVEVRCPDSTRPWQHVLEPLSGYLNLGAELYMSDKLQGEAFNLGPKSDQNHTVRELLLDLSSHWHFTKIENAFNIIENTEFKEAKLLKLDCTKALYYLNWESTLEYKDTIRFTSEWYYDYYNYNKDMLEQTFNQISEYEEIAKMKGLKWMD